MTEMEDLLAEELRPYRKVLTDVGMREARDLVRDLEGDPQAEAQRVYGYLSLAEAQHEAGEAAAARESGSRRSSWPRPSPPAIPPHLPGSSSARSSIG